MPPPDTQLYPEFEIILKNAMLHETRAFIREMIDADLSVTNVIHSELGMLNERLVRHYRITKIPLAPHHYRGGITPPPRLSSAESGSSSESSKASPKKLWLLLCNPRRRPKQHLPLKIELIKESIFFRL